MTFNDIINQYAGAVYSTGLLSKCGGLAQVSNVSAAGTNQTVVIAPVYPFADAKQYTISPDSKESGIAFFRASATQITRQSAYLHERRNTVTLTVWINGDKVKQGDGFSAFALIQDTVRRFRPTLSDGQYRKVSMQPTGNVTDGIERYGWDGLKFKYHEAPHMLFNIEFQFQAWVSAGCATPTYQIVNPVC